MGLSVDKEYAEKSEEEKAAMHPRFIAPIVTWLMSAESSDVTGRVFEASGHMLAVAEGWHRGPTIDAIDDPTQIGEAARQLVRDAQLNSGMDGQPYDGGLLG